MPYINKLVIIRLTEDEFVETLKQFKDRSDDWDVSNGNYTEGWRSLSSSRYEDFEYTEHFNILTGKVYAFEYWPFRFEIKEGYNVTTYDPFVA